MYYSGRRKFPKKAIIIGVAAILLIALAVSAALLFGNGGNYEKKITSAVSQIEEAIEPVLLARAEALAAGYDYDGAITLISGLSSPVKEEAVTRYEAAKAELVAADIYDIPHVFFHSLIADTSKAFDGDFEADGYNQVMTTVDEFNKIMQQMYDRGFVLVSMHDIAEKQADGSFKKGQIMLPPGKRPFVLSVDDVCYYEYMEGDGFATRIIIDENGKPTCEMKQDDGSIAVGDFDVAPLLERFIEAHPDFSYKGARGILAFTGYNGVLGYRTCPSYSDSPTYAEDCEAVRRVAKALRDGGWELASHSWGHRDLGKISLENLKTDTMRWENEVEALIGETDILIYPFGADIESWHPYSADNERFKLLKSVGFDYFCNVDSSEAWVQLGSNYLRQGRRNLDGYRMYYDMLRPERAKLTDLFDVKSVFDPARPTPVPPMG